MSILWWGVVSFPLELSSEMVEALLAALGPLAFFFVPTGRIEALLHGDQDPDDLMSTNAVPAREAGQPGVTANPVTA